MKLLQQKLTDILLSKVAPFLNISFTAEQLTFQSTRKEFTGDITLVCFPFGKLLQCNPDQAAQKIGTALLQSTNLITTFEVVKGFLNLSIHNDFWENAFLEKKYLQPFAPTNQHIVVEYSSPNTNKPLHLGHIRNNLLGYSVAKIIEAAGNKVSMVQIINDRGIHICKSMLAWKKFGNGETPISSGLKGDHLVGKYYVIFEEKYREQVKSLVESGMEAEKAKKEAPLMLEAKRMLQLWENNEDNTIALWKEMNSWVYSGFESTYKRLGVFFDKNYFESETYILGKSMVEEGLQKKVFYQKDDGSVWVDLTNDGLDEKLLLRSDGTSVYITQDLGTAVQRYKDLNMDGMLYTVGNEQDYHFKVLFLILKKLGYQWAKNCYHLSYGMVDLPTGRMKSREGTVVDADDLMGELFNESKNRSLALGKLDEIPLDEQNTLFEILAMGALKYFILKVDPKKRMVFNPEESIDLQGNTGPFIQYAHARIQSVLRKANHLGYTAKTENINYQPQEEEKEVLKQLLLYPDIISLAAAQFSPSLIAAYCYDLAHLYNKMYHNITILGETDQDIRAFRLAICEDTAKILRKALALLGISAPERM